MKKMFSLLIAGAMLIGIHSFNMAPAANSACLDTFRKFNEGWNTANLEAEMALFADDAVVTFLPPPPGKGVYTGKTEIEEFAKSVMSGPFHAESQHLRVNGDTVRWEFSVDAEYFKKGLGVNPVTGTGELVVKNGKVKSFTPTFDSETMSKSVALRFFSLLDEGKLDDIEKEIFTPDAVIHFPGTSGPSTVAEFKQMGAMFGAAFPDGKHVIGTQIAEGDKVATYMTFNATHTGDFMGVKPTGKPVSINGVSIDKIKDGKVVERWVSFDQLGMMQQIGAIPMPGQVQAKK